jgi:hypothetical protein
MLDQCIGADVVARVALGPRLVEDDVVRHERSQRFVVVVRACVVEPVNDLFLLRHLGRRSDQMSARVVVLETSGSVPGRRGSRSRVRRRHERGNTARRGNGRALDAAGAAAGPKRRGLRAAASLLDRVPCPRALPSISRSAATRSSTSPVATPAPATTSLPASARRLQTSWRSTCRRADENALAPVCDQVARHELDVRLRSAGAHGSHSSPYADRSSGPKRA